MGEVSLSGFLVRLELSLHCIEVSLINNGLVNPRVVVVFLYAQLDVMSVC